MNWSPTSCGRRSNRYCRRSGRSPRAGGPGCPTAPPCAGSSSCCGGGASGAGRPRRHRLTAAYRRTRTERLAAWRAITGRVRPRPSEVALPPSACPRLRKLTVATTPPSGCRASSPTTSTARRRRWMARSPPAISRTIPTARRSPTIRPWRVDGSPRRATPVA